MHCRDRQFSPRFDGQGTMKDLNAVRRDGAAKSRNSIIARRDIVWPGKNRERAMSQIDEMPSKLKSALLRVASNTIGRRRPTAVDQHDRNSVAFCQGERIDAMVRGNEKYAIHSLLYEKSHVAHFFGFDLIRVSKQNQRPGPA